MAASAFICEEVGNRTSQPPTTSQHHVLAWIWPRNCTNVNVRTHTYTHWHKDRKHSRGVKSYKPRDRQDSQLNHQHQTVYNHNNIICFTILVEITIIIITFIIINHHWLHSLQAAVTDHDADYKQHNCLTHPPCMCSRSDIMPRPPPPPYISPPRRSLNTPQTFSTFCECGHHDQTRGHFFKQH